jgi:glycosyltransferase involved in cell wall biosynthesis
MRIVFVHQNFPGQFGRLASIFAGEGHEVVALGTRKSNIVPGVRYYPYTPAPGPDAHEHHGRFAPVLTPVQRAYGAALQARQLAKEGFSPDLVVVNVGWGEGLFLKDIWPKARHVAYFEYFYAAQGQDLGFDPEFPVRNPETIWRLRLRNALLLSALDSSDAAVSPTRYQRDTFPPYLRDRIAVIHDGIDTQALQPNRSASIQLGENGPRLGRETPLVTYVTRNIEPMRGSHVVIRSLPGLLALDPDLRVVCIGGSDVSYSAHPPPGKTWLEIFRSQVEGSVDWSRVHFVGRVPYGQFVRVLQASSAHLYLTYPFVLSWSLIEAMALECHIVASATPPVEEVIQDGETGRLFPFFDETALVERVRETLADREGSAAMAGEARRRAQERYDFTTVCLPQWREFLGVG